MKLNRLSFTFAILALAAVACVAAILGHPVTSYLPHDVLAGLGALGAIPFTMGATKTIQEQIADTKWKLILLNDYFPGFNQCS